MIQQIPIIAPKITNNNEKVKPKIIKNLLIVGVFAVKRL